MLTLQCSVHLQYSPHTHVHMCVWGRGVCAGVVWLCIYVVCACVYVCVCVCVWACVRVRCHTDADVTQICRWFRSTARTLASVRTINR